MYGKHNNVFPFFFCFWHVEKLFINKVHKNMIVTRTFFDKSNTIIKNNRANTGLNPVLELNYGPMLTRGLFHFDTSEIECRVKDKTYPDITKLKHVLHMTNAASFNINTIDADIPVPDSEYIGDKQRAISFAIILFLIPEEWDSGRGFDYVMDIYNTNKRAISVEGSNWYCCKSHRPWSNGEGVYSTDRLSKELDLFTSKAGNKSNVIIAYEKFDYGNENICIDITETVNKFITGELPNYGIGIAFSPMYENCTDIEFTQYVGFFTQHTHSFFEPYIQTKYDDYIDDDRNRFPLDTDNELYFYANVGGNFVNLDEMPICNIDDKEYNVEQVTKGVYRVKVNLSSSEYEPDTMVYDVWSNIIYNGKKMPDVEMQFATYPSEIHFSFGPLPKATNNKYNVDYIPSVYGIRDSERIPKGDIMRIGVECKIKYTSDVMADTDGIFYRLYVDMDGKQIDVINWTQVERDTDSSYILLDTNGLVPYRYYLDMRVIKSGTVKVYPKVLTFDIVNDITNEKH